MRNRRKSTVHLTIVKAARDTGAFYTGFVSCSIGGGLEDPNSVPQSVNRNFVTHVKCASSLKECLFFKIYTSAKLFRSQPENL